MNADYSNIQQILTEHSGDGKLAGVLTIKGQPAPDCLTRLFSEEHDFLLQTGVTGPGGEFEFTGLNKSKQFYILFKTTDGLWEHLVTCRREPV